METTPFETSSHARRKPADLLRLSHVHKLYGGGLGGVHALHDINLHVAPAEMVAVCGPSGSGKTTLLNLVGMLEQATEGSVVIANLLISKLSEQARADLRADMIGFVFQSFSLIPVMSARENVLLPLVLRGHMEHAQMVEAELRAGDLLAQLGLAGQAACYPPKLDASQCQRVAIARSLIARPRLIIADEPVSRQGSGAVRMVMDLFARQQQEHGTAFLISTRDQRQFSRATRAVQLNDGRVVGAGNAAPRKPMLVEL